jgi:hypothetical protein
MYIKFFRVRITLRGLTYRRKPYIFGDVFLITLNVTYADIIAFDQTKYSTTKINLLEFRYFSLASLHYKQLQNLRPMICDDVLKGWLLLSLPIRCDLLQRF